MVYIARTITDRIAEGDDRFTIEKVGVDENGKDIYKLTPKPISVTEPGTDINKALLQLIEDRVVLLMNSVFNGISSNPFNITFESLDGLTVEGVWNTELNRVEC